MATNVGSTPDQPSDDVFQLVVDTLEEIAVTVLEGIRERPGLALTLIAGVAGALVGLVFAAGKARELRKPAPAKTVSNLFAGWTNALDLEDRTHRVATVARKSAKRADRRSSGLFGDLTSLRGAADLVPVTLRLLENPIVRSYIRATLAKQISGRFRS